MPDERVIFCAFLLLGSAAIGSFLATCVARAARQVPVFGASRSHCTSCGDVVPAYALLPVLGFIVLRGRCVRCGSRIDALHPMMEIATVIVFASMLWAGDWSLSPEVAGGLVLGTALVFLAFHDAWTGRLPDVVTLPLIGAGVAVSYGLERVTLPESVLGAVLGGAVSWAVALVYSRLRGHDGLGLGDVKLIAGLGAWLGAGALPALILLSSGSALAFLFAKETVSRSISRNARISFGPFLAVAGWALWLLKA